MVETFEISNGSLGSFFTQCWLHVAEERNPTSQVRYRAAGMGENEGNIWISFQRATVEEIGHCSCSIEDEVDERRRQGEFGYGIARRHVRMNKNHGLAAVEVSIQSIKFWISLVLIANAGKQHNPVKF